MMDNPMAAPSAPLRGLPPFRPRALALSNPALLLQGINL